MGDETRRKFFGSLVSEDVEEALAAALDIHEENPKEASMKLLDLFMVCFVLGLDTAAIECAAQDCKGQSPDPVEAMRAGGDVQFLGLAPFNNNTAFRGPFPSQVCECLVAVRDEMKELGMEPPEWMIAAVAEQGRGTGCDIRNVRAMILGLKPMDRGMKDHLEMMVSDDPVEGSFRMFTMQQLGLV